jgi:anti-sigma B factor antagonist
MKTSEETGESGVADLKGIIVVSPEGKLDISAAEGFVQMMNHAEKGRPGRLILDLSKVSLIASVGLRQIMQSAKNAREDNRDFVICNPKGIVKEVLEISGFYHVITIYDSLDQAMHA